MSRRTQRRPILLLIDVEPDLRAPARGDPGGWDGTRIALPLIRELRGALARKTGAPVVLNWFLRIDPQIEATWGRADHVRHAAPDLLADVATHGDYSGIHPHLWRWSDAARAWYGDLRDAAWMRHCLDTAIAGYGAIFGRAPEACRFGDRWSSDEARRCLAERGIRYELGTEPGRPQERPPGGLDARGTLPDTRSVPRVPFPAPDAAAAGLWVLPVTTSRPRWQPTRNPPFLVAASVSPNLGLEPLLVGPHLEEEIARDTTAPLVLVLRSGDLCSRRRRANFRRNARRLLAQPGLERCLLTTPPEAIRRWLGKAP